MPQNLGWRDAIIEVLKGAKEPLHYTDISDKIIEQGLRTEYGATPVKSVAAYISVSIRDEGAESPFVRVSKGVYAYRTPGANQVAVPPPVPAIEVEEEGDETGLINALGMYWKRDLIHWAMKPKLLGRQQTGSDEVDFSDQKGVYLLHDGNRVVYVGRTTNQTLGIRLAQHISDRLNTRWDRFSWFGICEVGSEGQLNECDASTFTLDLLIATMEALLIEGLEPPQNRQRGKDFRAVEYIQVKDPAIKKAELDHFMNEMRNKMLKNE
jgi:HB1, ASXL, restriction endonuclease HTH domain